MQTFITDTTKTKIGLDYILNKIDVITTYGIENKKNLKQFMPGEEERLINELDRVELMCKLIKDHRSIYIHLKSSLSHIKDLRRSISRAIDGDTLTVVELFEIKTFILLLKEINTLLSKLDWKLPENMMVEPIGELEELFDPKKKGIKTFYIYDEYSVKLKDIRDKKKKLAKRIKLENKNIRDKIKTDLGIAVKPNGEIIVAKDELELLKTMEEYPLLTYSAETYMNKKYCIKPTDMINKLIKELELLKVSEEEEEYRIREELSKKIASHSETIHKNMIAIGTLDLTIAKAYLAIDIKGVRPEIRKEQLVRIVEGRHPQVEEALKNNNGRFIPISVDLRSGVTCITGANMGGKTVSLKLMGLLKAMAQYGLFVPCCKMETGLSEFIYVSIGDVQSTDMGLSTFGGEIKDIKTVINRCDKNGLILIDELASGTNPQEGYAITKAIVNHLKNKSSISIITTHYDNVADTEEVTHLQVIGLEGLNYQKLKEEMEKHNKYGIEIVNLYMDYRLKEVKNKAQVPRDAINIARLMGLEESIVDEAIGILNRN